MSTKFMIILIVVFVLILGMMGTGFFFMWTKLNAVNAQQINTEQDGGAATVEPPKIGPLHPLETFIVNLADEGGNRYLRTTRKSVSPTSPWRARFSIGNPRFSSPTDSKRRSPSSTSRFDPDAIGAKR